MDEQLKSVGLSFEQQHLQAEQAIRRDEIALRREEFEFRKGEARANAKKADFSRWSNPLVVSILTVAATGLLNVVSVLMTNNGQTELESSKHNHELRVEADKATRMILSSIGELQDQAQICRRMRYIDDTNFTDTPAFASSIKNYISQKCETTVTPPAEPRIVVPWTSDWLGGGRTQPEQCGIGQADTQKQYPGRRVVVTSSGEDSRKDWLGRVTYRYFCSFEVL
jgi:hypothetical protein